MTDEKGVWRTVSGRRIFIRDGQSLEEAMQASGKFSVNRKKAVQLEPAEYRKVVSEINTYYHGRFAGKQIGFVVVSHDFGAYYYRFEIYGFDRYRFIHREKV